MGSLWPFSALGAAKLHGLRFLISLPLHNEAVVAPREVLWMQKVSEQRCIWWGCQGPSHQPATQRVALFNAPLLVCLNTSSLRRTMTAKNKKTLLSCPLSMFPSLFVSPLLFHFCFIQTGIGQGTSNLFLRQAAPQWVLAGLKGFLPSLRLFQHPLPFGWGRKDVSSRAEAYSFVGCRRLTHCRSFGNKSGWLYSLGPGCFSHQCAKDMSRKHSNLPAFLF